MDKQERLQELLCQHAVSEWKTFLSRMKELTSAEVILRAGEISAKEDIYFMIVDGHEFELEDLEVLSRLKKPIDACYTRWMNGDKSEYNEELRVCMEDMAAEQRQREDEKGNKRRTRAEER